MTFPKLSVVMPAHNAERYIRLALQSLLDQTETQFEIVVIDDGSHDKTAQIVREFADESWPKVRLIQQENAGVSAARNVGIKVAIAPLVGFLDADDIWGRTKVARHLDLMETRPDIDLGFSSFGFIDTNGDPLIDQSILKEGRYSHNDLIPRNFIHTSTVIARREALLAVDGFDETLETYEDFDLWLRIAELREANLYALEDKLAYYRRHDTQTTAQWAKMHEGWKRVAKRLERDHPAAWHQLKKVAWGNQYEYAASLAYNADDIPQMRSLMWKAWKAAGIGLFKDQNSIIMLGIAVASRLPLPVQRFIGRTFNQVRLIKRRIEGHHVAQSGKG